MQATISIDLSKLTPIPRNTDWPATEVRQLVRKPVDSLV
jgi:hypothetical protein